VNLEDIISMEDLLRLAAASILIVVVMVLSHIRKLEMVSDLAIASVRAFIQLLILALFLQVIFDLQDMIWIVIILGAMMVIASYISARRARDIPRSFRVSAVSIFVSSSAIILAMVVLGVIPQQAEYLIPLGGMVIGNAMNIISLALERLRGEVNNNVMMIDNMLALGASPNQAIFPLVKRSIRASLIPTVDNMKTMGLVWIPGLMSGMIIGGMDPGMAAMFQLIIIFMILASNTIASILSTMELSKMVFGPAEQLVYRP
jgi:putative ABC transport system permease protein